MNRKECFFNKKNNGAEKNQYNPYRHKGKANQTVLNPHIQAEADDVLAELRGQYYDGDDEQSYESTDDSDAFAEFQALPQVDESIENSTIIHVEEIESDDEAITSPCP